MKYLDDIIKLLEEVLGKEITTSNIYLDNGEETDVETDEIITLFYDEEECDQINVALDDRFCTPFLYDRNHTTNMLYLYDDMDKDEMIEWVKKVENI